MSIGIRDLLEAGAHFGHQTHRWNPKMRPYIYGARNGIYIINLQKTAALWKDAYEAIVQSVRSGKKVLFVGTKNQAQEVVEEEAVRAEQFFVNRRWLGGMLTNFQTIRGRLNRLEELDKLFESGKVERLQKKEVVTLRKERQKLDKSLSGIKKMNGVPGVLVIVDPNREHIAVKEARKLGIPIVAITDTNCDPEGIDYVVPANDDALKSIRLFMKDAAEACLDGAKEFERRIQKEAAAKAAQAPKEEAAPSTDPSTPPVERVGENVVGTIGDKKEHVIKTETKTTVSVSVNTD